MAVLNYPDASSPELHACVICGEERPMEDLTAGRCFRGEQAFACNSHFFDSDRLYRGWATFVTSNRRATDKSATTAEDKTHHAQTALH